MLLRGIILVTALGLGACGGSSSSDAAGGASGSGGTSGAGATGGSGGASTGGSGGTSTGGGGTGGSGGAPSCGSGGVSDLTDVTIVFPEQPCTFTLAQAAAGIEIQYQVLVANAVTGVVPQGQSSCPQAGPSGLYVFEQLSGNAQSYCLCDTGLCVAPPDTPVTIAQGTFDGKFSWDGKNWTGPSDFGNPKGSAFPPGTYTLEVSAKGKKEGAPYSVVGKYDITLTP